jgi:teichuronic acid biosynthesis glycosyltransferase TuaH
VMGNDVVYALFQTSWAGAVARGLCMPEDRLAAALPAHPRVRRALVVNPPRNVAARWLRPAGAPYPAPPGSALHEPLRLRRSDPADPAAACRAAAAYERSLRRAAGRMGLERPAIITTHPVLAGFGDFGWAGPVTYYAWDDWTASQPHRRWWPVYEQAFARLRERGRAVCAVSDTVLGRVAPTGPAAVVPNGIDPAEWLDLPAAPAWFSDRPAPRLLYVGSLDHRVDVDQVRRLAAALPGGSVTLVGELFEPDHYAPLIALPNVEVRPRVARRELAGLVAAADACLIPHVRNAMTEAMSPLKLYEYLAGGRPVAAVDLPGIAGVDPRVQLVAPGADLTPAVERALAAGPASEAERRRFVAEHAWDRRFDRIVELALDGAAPLARAA